MAHVCGWGEEGGTGGRQESNSARAQRLIWRVQSHADTVMAGGGDEMM